MYIFESILCTLNEIFVVLNIALMSYRDFNLQNVEVTFNLSFSSLVLPPRQKPPKQLIRRKELKEQRHTSHHHAGETSTLNLAQTWLEKKSKYPEGLMILFKLLYSYVPLRRRSCVVVSALLFRFEGRLFKA